MKVFGIGLGKTGTTSLGVALGILGFRHKSFDKSLLRAFAEEDKETLRQVISKYDSFDDFPWPLLYRSLAEEYPNARFVLTTRDSSEAWYTSLYEHAKRGVGCDENRRIAYGYARPEEDKQYHLELYRRHLEDVRNFFVGQEDRLVEVCWENGDGWHELCEFLDRSLPDVPFPYANRKPSWWRQRRRQLGSWARRNMPRHWLLNR